MPRKKSKMIHARNLRLRILGVAILTIFAVSVFGYYSFYFRQPSEVNQPMLDPGYRYQQIGPIDVKTLEQLGVRSTQNFSNSGITYNGYAGLGYNYTGIQWTGNFSWGNKNAWYRLSNWDTWISQSEPHSNGTALLVQHYIRYVLAIGFVYAKGFNSLCNLARPNSDINCNDTLVVNFDNSTSSQTRSYTLTTPYDNVNDFCNVPTPFFCFPSSATVYFVDSDPSTYLLNSHLTFILGTFQGYPWCPIYGVDNMTRLLCRFNPDYKYLEIASMNVSNLPSRGRFTWQNVALNYSFANVILEVTDNSGPSCDVEKPITQANCQAMLLIGFEIANPPTNSGTPSEIAYPIQVGKTETFQLYPSNSGVHEGLYVVFGSYVGDYKGVLSPWYRSDYQSIYP